LNLFMEYPPPPLRDNWISNGSRCLYISCSLATS